MDPKGQLAATFKAGSYFGDQVFQKAESKYNSTIVAEPFWETKPGREREIWTSFVRPLL